MQQQQQQESRHDTHSGWHSFAASSALAVIAAATLAGCTARRPEASVFMDADPRVEPLRLVANDRGRDEHFTFNSLTATFGSTGTYRIVDNTAGKDWKLSISTDDLGKPISLPYNGSAFWCTRYQPSYPITVLRVNGTNAPELQFTSLRPVPVE